MIKITTSKAELAKALEIPTFCVATSGSDISTHYTFRYANEKIQVYTYNKRIFSTAFLDCDYDGISSDIKVSADPVGLFTVEAKRLHKLLAAEDSDDNIIIFEFNKSLTIKTPLGSNKYQSLQPNLAPSIDQNFKTATPVIEISAQKLAKALDFTKNFTMGNETAMPEFCVVAFRQGYVQGSDGVSSLGVVEIPELVSCDFKIYQKNFSAFLELFNHSGTVKISKSKSLWLYQRSDGTTFGEHIFHHDFPNIPVNRIANIHHKWTFSKAHLKSRIQFLVSGADWQDHRLTFRPQSDDIVVIEMQSAFSGEDVSCELSYKKESSPNVPPIPKKGFKISYLHLLKVLDYFPGDSVTIGLVAENNMGAVRLEKEEDGLFYLALLSWLR